MPLIYEVSYKLKDEIVTKYPFVTLKERLPLILIPISIAEVRVQFFDRFLADGMLLMKRDGLH